MKNKRYLGIMVFLLAIITVIMACGLTGGADPTQAPVAEEPTAAPTEVPPEPTSPPPPEPTATTEVVEEPTEEPAEEPVEETEPPAEPETPEETPPPNEIFIEQINGFIDDSGSLHIIGLVTNNTDRAVDSVEVEIQVFDTGGNSLYTEVSSISLYTLAPGESSPFSHWIYDDLPDADNYSAIIVGQSTADIERTTVDLEGVLLTVDESGDVHLTGNLVNNTDTPVEISSMAGATFDDGGNLYTADSHTVLIRYLDPGEDGPFRITMTGPDTPDISPAEYALYIDAEVSDPSDPYNLVFSETNHNYVDKYGSFHLVGTITNNHDEILSITLIGGIYDEDGNVLDAATSDIPTYSLAPGETMPYDFQYWGPLNFKETVVDSANSYTVQWDPYWTWTSTSEYNDLTSQNDAVEADSYQATFTGEVLNDSGTDVDGATIIVSLYDLESGELVAMGYGGIYDPIVASASAEYKVWVDIPDNFDINTVDVEIIVKGDLP